MSEGIRRISILIKGMAVVVLLLGSLVVWNSLDGVQAGARLGVALLVAGGAAGVLFAIAWVIDGFARGSRLPNGPPKD